MRINYIYTPFERPIKLTYKSDYIRLALRCPTHNTDDYATHSFCINNPIIPL